MSEIRLNPISKRAVIFTDTRENKPSDFWDSNVMSMFDKFEDVIYKADCPFCRGNEYMTPKACEDGSCVGDWQVRAVPNLYPIIQTEFDIRTTNRYCYVSTGMHDVIIETPYHNRRYFDMSIDEFELIYSLIHRRFKEHLKNRNISYVSLFKNYKMLAGASMQHSHSQIISLDAVPVKLSQEIHEAKNHYLSQRTCVVCNMLRFEIKVAKRLIYQNDDFAAIEPYAPAYKYETWILPKKHMPFFDKEDNITSLSDAICNVFHMLYNTLGDFPFNMYLNYLIKKHEEYERAYHYYFKIVPKLSAGAGFEMASGIRVNSVLPEVAAEQILKANSNRGRTSGQY